MYKVVGTTKNRTLRVLWMLEELGQQYTLVSAGARSDEATSHNPTGKVPVLLDGDAKLIDSTAIMTYLGDKHGGLTHRAGTRDRARQDGHTQFVLDEMDAVLWTAARHTFVLPEEHRVPQVKHSLRWEFQRSLDRLDTRLSEGSFLMGTFMTIPDIIAAHCLRWARNAKFPEPSENLKAYFDRLTSRAAFLRASNAE